MLFPQAKDPSVAARVIQNDWWREEFEKSYAKECVGSLPDYTYEHFMSFFKTGDRTSERFIFARRRRMGLCAIKAFFYDDADALAMLHTTIWEVCNEATWSVPAHIEDVTHADFRSWIDLLAAETGFALCEILYLLDGKLDAALVNRVRLELQDRIVMPYLTHTYWWEEVPMNWSAVCAGSIGAVFMYQFQEKFPLVKARILHSMDCFLSGFGIDGICTEGVDYWNYGFGFFVYFAQLLLEFSNGEIDLFQKEIVKKVAQFQNIMFLYGDSTISFSDASADSKWLPGLVNWLCQKYAGYITLPNNDRWMLHGDSTMHFCDLVRNILWTERLHDTANAQKDTMYFSDAQWYIAHRTGFGFAAKGGHNDEPHNHNDLGHFILATAHGQVLCDLGAGVYNKAYFIPDTRYDVIHTNSLGHSVPIIEGHQQVAGREHCAVVFEHGQDTFSLELAKAYDLPGLQSFQRSFHIAANGFALLDTFGFSGDVLSIIERFVTPIMPIEQKNGIRIGNAVLTWEIPATFVIKNVEIITHAHQPSVCYLIDILLPAGCTQFEMNVKVEE